ncbi:hypothetical protein NA57DRAFT_59091 [Rhizodiscina lignyota]|uniref:Uncharacterized protein n=1 Tax=Rhizodiscina lignyota TaxID=1504668 RepID=A0A9P4ICJ5_9PEZI|nr:hypothetical protein NA57DRAFT_59091 [Rhizodiscina lignyota]
MRPPSHLPLISCSAQLFLCCLVIQIAAAQAPFNPGFNDTWNQNYFGFPALVNWIPLFKVGDVLNSSWSDSYVGDKNYINVWCGTPGMYLAQTFNNLEQNGNELLTVLNTWLDPCHLEFVVDENNGTNVGTFNSGAFNINNHTGKVATPTTWGATGPFGGVQTYTGGTFKPTASTTKLASTNRVSSTSPDATRCPTAAGDVSIRTSNGSKGPSFGAGIGVGIAIAVVTGAIGAALLWAVHRQRLRGRKVGEEAYTNVNPGIEKFVGQVPVRESPTPAQEVHATAARSEVAGDSMRIEMPTERY